MPRVVLTPHLRQMSDDADWVVDGETVREVLERCFVDRPTLRGYVLDDQGSLRKHVNIFVNGNLISDRVGLADRVSPDDELYVLQALSGG